MNSKKLDLQTPSLKNILHFLESCEAPISKRDIAKAFEISGSEDRVTLKKNLRSLFLKGLIDKIDSRFFIKKQQKQEASPKDEQLGNHTKDKKLPTPEDSPEIILGYVEQVHKEHHLIPINKRDNRQFFIPKEQKIAFSVGDFCQAQIKNVKIPQRARQKIEVLLIEVRSNINDNIHLSDLAIAEQNIPHEFPELVIDQSKIINTITENNAEKYRKNLIEIPFITIDGADAKDFDDAIWAQKDKNGFTLKVAIADVAAYVPYGSELDNEAYKRGNSVYFPDCVVPMLPERLSNNLCSLRPHEIKAVFVATLLIDNSGVIHNYHFERALIQSIARTTYEQIQECFDKKKNFNSELSFSHIALLYEAYNALNINRKSRETLEIDRVEYKIYPKSKLREQLDVVAVERLDSHCLIEEFMIAANVAAARTIDNAKIPGFYRVHDNPSPEKTFNLQTLSQALRLTKKKVPNILTANFFNDYMNAYKDEAEYHLIQDLVLRSQSQAQYRRQNIGHFGLSLTHYSHFTSPIRRYSDLIVHRLLIHILKLGEAHEYTQDQLDEAGTHLCITERRAIQAERDTQYRYMAQYLEQQKQTHFLGYIMGVSRYGLFVFLPEVGTEGFLPKRLFPQERFRFFEDQQKYVGRDTGRTFQMGQKIPVKLLETNVIRGQILLTFNFQDDVGSLPRLQKSKNTKNKKFLPKKLRSTRRDRRVKDVRTSKKAE